MIITLDTAHTAKALAQLGRKDKKLGALIRTVGECRLAAKDHPDLFGTLAEAIVSQQLSGKAAATIFGRFCVLLGADDKKPHPRQLADVTGEQLRSVGLSRAKALAVQDLAAKIEQGIVLPLSVLETLPDEDIVRNLTQVRGIGRWTAEMFLMFQLGRADVLPVDDLGVRKGFMLTYGLDAMPDKKQLTEHAIKWQPYRSVASWYMWRAAELASGPERAHPPTPKPANQTQFPPVIWLTGLSGAGKSTIAQLLATELESTGTSCFILDGDVVRKGLSSDLGFSNADRAENIRRVAEVARLKSAAGTTVIVALISPMQIERDKAKQIIGADRFLEIYIDVPLSVAEKRDVKGLYKKARSGIIKQFTGIDSPYEAPANPALHVFTDKETPHQSLTKVLQLLSRFSGK